MDFNNSINKIYNLYNRVKKFPKINPGFGFYHIRYETKSNNGFFFAVISPPAKPGKGKKKEFDKIFQKSSNSGKIIIPKEFQAIISYLSSVFPSIIVARNKLMDSLETLIAGMRLTFIPYENIKYEFLDIASPDIFIYDTIINGQFCFYINVVGLQDKGLILAYEKQMDYLKQEISKGNNPLKIQNLPSLRTGQTRLQTRSPTNIKEEKKKKSIKEFRKKIKQKRLAGEVEEELESATVIDFSPHSDEPFEINKRPIDNNSQSSNMLEENPKPAPISYPKGNLNLATRSTSETEINPNIANQTEINDLENNISIFTQEIKDIKKKNRIFMEEIKSLKIKNYELEQKNQDFIQLKGDNRRLNNQIVMVTDNLTKQLHEKDNENQKLMSDINESKKRFKKIIPEITQSEKLKKRLKDLIDENELLAKALKEGDIEKKKIKADLVSLELENKQILEEKLNLEILFTDLQGKHLDLLNKVEEIQNRTQ